MFEGPTRTQLNIEQPRLNRGPGRLQPHRHLLVRFMSLLKPINHKRTGYEQQQPILCVLYWIYFYLITNEYHCLLRNRTTRSPRIPQEGRTELA